MPYKNKEDQRLWYEANKVELRSYKAKWAREHPSARSSSRNEPSLAKNTSLKVCRAVKDGKLMKGRCELCSSEDTRAHHDDYSKPLEVRWLCPLHHSELHRRIRLCVG